MKQHKRVVYNTIYTCDKCGKRYGYIQGTLKLSNFKITYPMFRQYGAQVWQDKIRGNFDLCPDCAAKVYHYIRRKENKEE